MTSAEIEAKQLALEEQRRMEGFLKQLLEVKRKLELVQDEAERWRKKKDSGTKDKAARLAAEAAIFEKAQNEDHDSANGLFDFADESLKFEQSAAVVGDLPIIPKPLTGISHEAEVNHACNCIVKQRHCRSC